MLLSMLNLEVMPLVLTSHVQYESHIPLLRLHNPLFLMKRNMRLFYRCYPMCKAPITSALAERAVTPRGDL